MRTRRLLCALALVAAAAVADAGSADLDAITLGAMAERAQVVALADAVSSEPAKDGSPVWTFRVAEAFRAPQGATTVRVTMTGGPASPFASAVKPGASHLVFLRTRSDGAYEPLELPWGLRDATAPDIAALVDYTRRYVRALAADGTVARPGELAALLVESLGSAASGVPFSAGRDLVRHEEIVSALTPAQRAAIDAALARPRKADQDLAAVIDAAGVAGTTASDDTLVARLLDPQTRTLRLNVTAALRRHTRPELVALLAKQLSAADARQRADLVNALGRLEQRAAEPHLTKALEDTESSVRVEAAHSLGLLARAVRAPRAGVDPEEPREKLATALAPLTRAVAAAKTDPERRALCWALAQLDTQEAWSALRDLREKAIDARTRELAAWSLLHPRVELILE
jgi:hypothetical protein